MNKWKDVKKVVLAYSGGLDTSIILKWLQTELGAEVVTFTADLGQGGELEPARKKAELLGIKEIYIRDVREEFVRDFVFPMFRANALYEGLLSARHVDRPAADLQASGRDRQGNRARTRSPMAPPARATTRSASSCRPMRSTPTSRSSRRGATGRSSRAPTCSISPSSTRSRSPRTSRARRRSRSTPTFCTRRPRARCSRIRGASRRNSCTSARSRRWTRRTR